MTERQQARAARREDTQQDETQATDLRDGELDEAVECCLAEMPDGEQ